jgi:hypothetical protein
MMFGNHIRAACAIALLLVCGLCSATSVSLSTVAAPGEIRIHREANFEVHFVASDKGWLREIIARSDAARREVNRETGDAMLATVQILLAPDREAFLKLVGNWAENAVAVAIGDAQQIVLNRDAIIKGPWESFASTVVHEFAHLYMSLRTAARVPRWLDEGVAMNIAGEWSTQDAASLVLARLTGQLIPLSELERSFPADAERQRLAYRQSYSMVRFMIDKSHGGSLPAFLQSITGQQGRARLDELSSDMHVSALERQWRKSLNSYLSWVLVLFSSGIFWGAAAVLVVVAFIVKRRRGRAMWEDDDDERIYAALDEEERRIWGDEDEDNEEDEDEEDLPYEER